MRGDRLRTLRERMKLTHETFAEMISTSTRQVARYESGDNDPSSEIVIKMADVLGVSTDYLLGRTDDPTSNLQITNLSSGEKRLINAIRKEMKYEAIKMIVDDEILEN